MMQTNRLRVSIVIPAYNEESYLPRCLDAIAAQIVKPFEVIVVDNNSTDRTAAIAASYDFVTVLHEARQGIVFTRDTGFDAARGDIIGRIDADTVLSANWVQQVQAVFLQDAIDAVTGKSHYYDIAFARFSNRLENAFRRRLVYDLRDIPFLQGSNMALTRRAWQIARSAVCRDTRLHEDFDLGIHLQASGFRVAYDERLVAGLSARRVDTPFLQGLHYIRMAPHTYYAHNAPGYRRMLTITAAALILYVPSRIMFRGYHPQKKRFSLRYALTNTADAHASPLSD